MNSATAIDITGSTPKLRALAAQSAREVLVRVEWDEGRPVRHKCRKDRNAFIEHCFSNPHDGGSPIIQGALHRRVQKVMAEYKRVIFIFPVEHGKTQQTKWSIIDLMGRHPDWCMSYIQAKATNAEHVVNSIKRLIEDATNGATEDGRRLASVYPNLKPEINRFNRAKEMWGTTALRIEGAAAGSNDPTLAAYGLDGKILGARQHATFMDNLLTDANTATPDLRKKSITKIDNEILTRLLKDVGRAYIFDTPWYHDDLLGVIGKRKGWHVEHFDAERPLRKKDKTLFPCNFTPRRLKQIQEDIPASAYHRMYRCKPLSASANLFRDDILNPAWGIVPWCETWNPDDEDWGNEGRPDEIRVCTGADLATGPGKTLDDTVLSTGVRIGNRYRLLNIYRAQLTGMQIIRALCRAWKLFHRYADDTLMLVEDNVAQKYIVDMMQDADVMQALEKDGDQDILDRLVVKGHTTTRFNKRTLETGIPSLASDFEMGRMMIPRHEETDRLRDEMMAWAPPPSHTGDALMSFWKMREGLRPRGPGIIVVD